MRKERRLAPFFNMVVPDCWVHVGVGGVSFGPGRGEVDQLGPRRRGWCAQAILNSTELGVGPT